MKTYILATFIAFIVYSNGVFGQLKINAELRPRFEFRHGYKSLPSDEDNASYFVSQRSRLNLGYNHEKYSFGFSLQDVRVWGDEDIYSSTGVMGTNASVDLYEAWMRLNIGSKAFVKVGRQEWNYDNQRLLSKRNWNQNGMAYDGVLLGYKMNAFQFDMGLSLNNEKENVFGNEYTPSKMKFLDFIYLKKAWDSKNYISFTGVLSGFQKEEDSETIYVSATFGPYLNIKKEKFAAIANVFYQTGTNQTGESINAYMFSVSGDYKVNNPITIGAGLDWLSGESDASGDNSFDILYGGRHRFFGEMDYFSNLVKSTSNKGLRDLFARADFNFNTAHSVNLSYHFFTLQDNFTGDTEEYKKPLGSELDIIYQFKATIPVNLRVGLSVFLPTETMEYLQSVETTGFSYFAYVQLTFTPILLSFE